MNSKEETIDTYNKNAQGFADKFDRVGVCLPLITQAFDIITKEQAQVLEIGCGNGRDASEILKRTPNYLGLDLSEEFIKLAQKNNPNGKFIVADIKKYPLPANLDIIFSFAALIHIPQIKLGEIFSSALENLNPGGLIVITMKAADTYQEVIKDDEFGRRTYYLYSVEEIKELASGFILIESRIKELRNHPWLELILQKPLKD